MKVTLESTSKVVELNGVPARIWEGTTEGGVEVHAYVTRIAVREDVIPEEMAIFERELLEQRAPSLAVQSIPLRLII